MTLNNKILFSTAVTTLLVTAVVWFGGFMQLSISEEKLEATNIITTEALAKSISATFVEKMASETTGMTRNREFIKLLKKPDESKIYEAVQPTFNRLKGADIVDHMVILDLKGNALYNSSKNTLSSNFLKPALEYILKESKNYNDYLMSGVGQTFLTYSFPVYRRGKLAAITVYLREKDKIAESLFQTTGFDVVSFSTNMEIGFSSSEEFTTAYTREDKKISEPSSSVISLSDKDFMMTYIPFINRQDSYVWSMAVFKDVTDLNKEAKFYDLFSKVAGSLVLLSALIIMYLVISKAFVPINKAREAVSYIADGDLTKEMDCVSTNEIAEMLSGIATMQDNLRGIISEVNSSSKELNKSAKFVRSASSRTSSNAEKQQQDTQSVATAMNELSATAIEVANNANRASEASKEVMNLTVHGNEIVDESIKKITELSDRIGDGFNVINSVKENSEEITGILDVIKGIAEQTNLLALNAAIEAARAGEQGRGFAVVADEVRNLANQTHESTEEINKMIERLVSTTTDAVSIMSESKENAQQGVHIISNAGDALNKIEESAIRSSEMNLQIAAAANEQGNVAESINENVMSISESAKSNTDDANEVTIASDQVSTLAEKMSKLMNVFKV